MTAPAAPSALAEVYEFLRELGKRVQRENATGAATNQPVAFEVMSSSEEDDRDLAA